MATTPTPRPVPTQEDRMRDARTDQPRTFATYLDRTERDQLDARAACAEQERDEALDDRDAYKEAHDVLRHQLDRLQPLIEAAKTWRYSTGTYPRSNDERALLAAIDAMPAALGSPSPRAQDDRPHPGLHVTRGTGPSDLESTCPCPKEPCGAVDTRRTNPDCEQHPGNRAKTMRQMHRADQCPAEREG